MELCPKCQANVEGLTHHCDCCGALLNEQPLFFIWHAFVTQASGDISNILKKIFRHLEEIDVSGLVNDLNKIAFAIYCYPEEIILNEKIKNNVYYSKNKKCARLNILIDYNAYMHGNTKIKTMLVCDAICASMHVLEKRMHRAKIDIADFFKKVEEKLSKIE